MKLSHSSSRSAAAEEARDMTHLEPLSKFFFLLFYSFCDEQGGRARDNMRLKQSVSFFLSVMNGEGGFKTHVVSSPRYVFFEGLSLEAQHVSRFLFKIFKIEYVIIECR